MILAYRDVEKHSIRQTVRFYIYSKSCILNVSSFKYSVHKFHKTVLYYNNDQFKRQMYVSSKFSVSADQK